MTEILPEHITIVEKIAHRLLPASGDNRYYDDLISEGLWALNKAAKRFDGRGSFKGYMAFLAKKQMLEFIRVQCRHKAMKIAEPSEGRNTRDNEIVYAGQEQAAERVCLSRLLSQLSRTEQAVIIGRFYTGFSITELSSRLKIPEDTLFWIRREALKSLKKGVALYGLPGKT